MSAVRGWIVATVLGAMVLVPPAYALATDSAPAHRYSVTLRDRGTLTEDEAAHVRLVDFERLEDGSVRVIYKTQGGF